MTELVSVVIPTHNRAHEVTRAAQSVLAQDLPALEVLVVDDASSDDTPEVLDRLSARDPRVRVIRSEKSVGPGGARNLGLDAANGDLVAFCDDDDTWLPSAGPTLVRFLDENRDFGAVSTWHMVLNAATGQASVYRGPLFYDSRQLLWQNFVGIPFGMIRRSAMTSEVRFDPDLPPTEDWDMWLRCAQQRRIRTLPRVGYLYIQHGGNRMTTGTPSHIKGRRRFLAKHEAEMSASCRLFHETAIAGWEGGRPGKLRRLGAGEGGGLVQDRGFVALLLATGHVASLASRRLKDPALRSRLSASLVPRDPTSR